MSESCILLKGRHPSKRTWTRTVFAPVLLCCTARYTRCTGQVVVKQQRLRFLYPVTGAVVSGQGRVVGARFNHEDWGPDPV